MNERGSVLVTVFSSHFMSTGSLPIGHLLPILALNIGFECKL